MHSSPQSHNPQRAALKQAAQFQLRDVVRVHSGLFDPTYTDIPIGGWVGSIAEIYCEDQVQYLIEWTPETMQQIHPVYRQRCARDGYVSSFMCLPESAICAHDCTPVEVEQPQQIITEPLNLDAPADRVREVFGLTSNDPLPGIEEASLQRYYDYLTSQLSFPFVFVFHRRVVLFPEDTFCVHVFGLDPPTGDPCGRAYGLLCVAGRENRRFKLPLYRVNIEANQSNFQLLADYSLWFTSNAEEGRL